MPCQTILLDGAMGTRLQQLTGNYQTRSPLWNVERPEMVRQVHQSYLQAGSEILLTNTFGAQAEEEFRSALHCIQNLPGQYRIAGSIGPTTSNQGARILAPQVDLFVLETYSDLKSARLGFESLEPFGKPIVVSFAWIYEDGFRLFSGESFSTVLGGNPAMAVVRWRCKLQFGYGTHGSDREDASGRGEVRCVDQIECRPTT